MTMLMLILHSAPPPLSTVLRLRRLTACMCLQLAEALAESQRGGRREVGRVADLEDNLYTVERQVTLVPFGTTLASRPIPACIQGR